MPLPRPGRALQVARLREPPGRAFGGAIGTVMLLLWVSQTAILQPLRLPVEAVVAGFGVSGLLRSRLLP
jgi:hypothetical protein